MIDYNAVRRANPLPEIVGQLVPLRRAGPEWLACCPFHADRSPSFTIYQGRDGAWRGHCFGCGWHGDVLDLVRRAYGMPLREAVRLLGAGDVPKLTLPAIPPADDTSRADAARRIWCHAAPVTGTLGETYLRFRGIAPPYPPDIRFTRLPCDASPPLSCLVLAVRDLEGAVTGIQRIWLAGDGRSKAAVARPKRSLGAVKGGAIRFGEIDASRVVTVCEGPEDGLSLLSMLGGSVWVAAGASFLPAMRFPPTVVSVIIGGDNDEAGRTAARQAATSFTERRLSVRIIYPLAGFKDFNDELRGATHGE